MNRRHFLLTSAAAIAGTLTRESLAQNTAAPTAVKIKKAGFCGVADTEENFCYWLRKLQERKVLPTY
jgi:hypothetical protein